jgi:hypothetical protein
MINKQDLKNILKQNVVSLNFKKVDGTDRKMLCSLKESFLPVVKTKETKELTKKKAENENVLSVWDLEKNAFRSFKIDSLIDYSIIKEGYEL